MITNEAGKAEGIAALDCSNTVAQAEQRLKVRNCPTISYYENGANLAVPDGSCSIFHVSGGGAKPCNALAVAQPCQERMNEMAEGEACGGLVYAGTYGGRRLYTTPTDTAAGVPWNNGSTAGAHSKVTGATSSNGMTNTNTLLAFTGGGQPYQAATKCRALGADWFLPSIQELNVLKANQNKGVLAGSFDQSATPPGTYWSSSESTFNRAQGLIFSSSFSTYAWLKPDLRKVRCVRTVN